MFGDDRKLQKLQAQLQAETTFPMELANDLKCTLEQAQNTFDQTVAIGEEEKNGLYGVVIFEALCVAPRIEPESVTRITRALTETGCSSTSDLVACYEDAAQLRAITPHGANGGILRQIDVTTSTRSCHG